MQDSRSSLSNGHVTHHRSDNLFRRAALTALATRLEGRPIACLPSAWLWLGLLCLALAVLIGWFAWTNEYARKESVRGWIVSEPGVVRLAHGASATVERVVRHVGDVLRRGDPILYLSNDVSLGGGGAVAQQILDQLNSEIAETEVRESIARQKFGNDESALTLQVEAIGRELRVLEGQVSEQQVRVAINADKLARLQHAYDNGAISELELLRHQEELAALTQSLRRLQQEHERVRRERQRLLASLEGTGIERDTRLSSIRSRRSELMRQITVQEEQRLIAVQSPIDGTLATLDLVAGTTVRPQQLLATVLPVNIELAVDVYIPSRAIGPVRPGQSVRLRYDAFPHRQFGMAKGRVESVAGFVLLPGDVPSTFGMREAAYRARISIERGRFALRPGMLLAAEITLENRRVADWLLAPLRAIE